MRSTPPLLTPVTGTESERLLSSLRRLEFSAVDPVSGECRRVRREERPESFVGGLDFALEGWARRVTPLPDNTGFLWMSERDGWRHVYLYDYEGKLVRQVTRGAFPVHQVAAVAPKGDAVFPPKV